VNQVYERDVIILCNSDINSK